MTSGVWAARGKMDAARAVASEEVVGGGAIGTSRAVGKEPTAGEGWNVDGGAAGSNFVGEEWKLTAVAYWNDVEGDEWQSVAQSKKETVSADPKMICSEDKRVVCDCAMVNKECRNGRLVRRIGEENLTLKLEVAEQKAEVQKLKTERKVWLKMQMAERRARDRKDIWFLVVFAVSIILAVICVTLVLR